MTIRYSPGGDWVCVARGSIVVLVPGATAPDVVDALWETLGDGADLRTVLQIVTGGFGTGLAAMPPFGVVSNAERLHVLLRGPVRLSVANGADARTDAVELTGDHVTTWTERILDGGTTGFTLSAGEDDGGTGVSYVLEAGVVRAHTVRVGTPPVPSDARPVGAKSESPPGAPAVTVAPAAAAPAVTPTPASASAFSPASEEPSHEEPEQAFTGALEAEESATINPNFFLPDGGGSTDPKPGEPFDPRSEEVNGDTIGAQTMGAPYEDGETEDDADEDGADVSGDDDAHGGAAETFGAAETPDAAEPDTATEAGTAAEPGEIDGLEDPELSTTGYDHFWDRTVVRRVEDAAIRSSDEDEADEAPQGSQGSAAHQVDGASATPDGVDSPEASGPAQATREEPVAIPRSPLPTSGGGAPPSSSGMIDSVPWARSRQTETEPPAEPQPAPQPPNGPAAKPATQLPEPATGVPSSSAGSLEASDDHDGQTVMRSDLPGNGLENPPEQATGQGTDPRPGTGPLVLARLCAQGHANPPEAPSCATCSLVLSSEPLEVRRPSLGTMRISSGEVVELDQSLIIGRQPSVSRVQGREMPKLVQVTSEGGDISRSHVEVRLDGWHVLLCDLRATNGTVLIRSGHPPRRLGEGETAFLLDGDVAQLGDDVFLRFEGLR